jgi:Tol biopolymer transport system component/DNA-binding winged helix-turn-helix (wHTH) protein
LGTVEPHVEPPRRQYSFGGFTLDIDGGFLRRGAEEVALRPKPFEVLLYLVEHHGRVVSKTELTRAVWPDVAVMDNTLAQCLVEIRRALGDASQQLIRTVARRGYVFTLPVTTPTVQFPRSPAITAEGRGTAAFRAEPTTGRRQKRRFTASTMALLAVAAGAGVLSPLARWMWRPAASEALVAMPLNSLPGVQRYPSFSPDGNHVAFTWTAPKQGNQDNKDVYVQQIGSGPPLRLTSDPRIDYSPAWSPDGRWIAFLRRQWQAGLSELRLIAPLGGPERKLGEIRVRDTYYINPPYLAWCPDSSCLVVTDSAGEGKPAALFLVSLENGDKKPLTHPRFPAIGDTNPAVSPDGHWLVFRRQVAMENGELYALRLGKGQPAQAPASAGSPAAMGEPQRITPATLNASYPTWIPGSDAILFSARESLWRLRVPGESTPVRLPFAGEDGIMPVVSGRAARLVYVRSFQDTNIWRVGVSAPGAPASAPPALAISSTRYDSTPQLSPDSSRVAFVSRRSGRGEIWVADPDGSNAVQLTSMGAVSGAPCWAPDGERIVFQSNPEGQFDVYVVPAGGGKPHNLTSHAAVDARPSFSRDGRWIYFTSNRTGQLDIWRMPTAGGHPVQVTTNGAFAAFESPDGAWLYYSQTMDTPSPLWRQPVSGGVPVKVLEGIVRAAFSVIEGGIYYIDRPSGEGGLLYTDQPSGETRLQYFDLANRRTTTVARNLGNIFLGLTASKDGRTILYSRLDTAVDDLMVVENFH